MPFLEFLHAQYQKFKHVFFVLGNHEFYGITRAEGLQLAAKLTQEPVLQSRLVLLERDRFDFPGQDVTLLGCTLHSCISQESRDIVQSKVKDFSRILQWTVDDHNVGHERDLRWLRDEITSIRNQERTDQTRTGNSRRKIVVVTHHAPIRKGGSHPQHENNSWSDGFATELLSSGASKMANPLLDVDWAVFGHTHFTTSCTRGSVKLISNQRGYVFPSQQQNVLGSLEGHGANQRKINSVVPAAKRQLSLFVARLTRRGNNQITQEPEFQEFDVARCIDV